MHNRSSAVADFGLYDGTHFREQRFRRWLTEKEMAWPHLPSGQLALDEDTFRSMAITHPELMPLLQLRQALAMFHLADLPVGSDGRNRCLLSPFGTTTDRCAPSTTGFIFGRPAWMRSLIRPEEGRALAYVDWSSQEFGIGAALSHDAAMLADYQAGDPYLAFARRINMVPVDATKASHQAERELAKTVILGTQYGMGERTLALRINQPVPYARELLQMHRWTYRKFWEWSDRAVNTALFEGRLWTRHGWQVLTSSEPNVRSLANFPCQGNGADMLRLASQYILEAGVQLDCTVHDAVLVEADAGDIDDAVARTRDAMARASRDILAGFELRTDAEVVRWPERYRDPRGAPFFDELLRMLPPTGSSE